MATYRRADGSTGDFSELKSGAFNEDDPGDLGISNGRAAKLADEIMADDSAPSTTPLPPGRSGVPQGYGKWGDLA
jgi:hypothetical protein